MYVLRMHFLRGSVCIYMYIDFTYTFSSVEGLFWPKRVFVPFFFKTFLPDFHYTVLFLLFFSQRKRMVNVKECY